MAEVDVSSYKLPAQPSALDIASKLTGLEQQKVGLDKSKLDLINQKYGIMKKEIFSLANDPNATPEMVVDKGQSLVKAGILKPDDFAKFVSNVPTDPKQVQTYLKQVGSTLLDTQAAINFQYGSPGLVQTGAAQVPIVSSPSFGVKQTGAPIQNQLGPGQLNTPIQVPNAETGTIDTVPTEKFIRDTGGNVVAPGQVAPVAPQAPRLPVQAPARAAAPQGRTAISGQSPDLEFSRKALAEDQAIATQKLGAIKPIVQVIPMLEGIKTGIGTEPYNKTRAALINLGFIDASATDPTVIYQEANKKLSQYIGQSPLSQRSDAGQTLATAGSPNVQGQLNPALLKLARDAVALDRVEAARPAAFEGKPSEYNKHRSTFPQSIDERAFSIDLMPAAERGQLIEDMKKKKDTPEGKKFWKSLSIADKQGLLNPVQ